MKGREKCQKFGLSGFAVLMVIFIVLYVDNNLCLWKSNDRVIIDDIISYIDYYSIFTITMATFLTCAFNQKFRLRIALIIVFFLIATRNLLHHFQYHYRAIHWNSMAPEAFFDSFWRIRPSDNFNKLLKSPNYQSA